jgi:hypothetical protein
MTESSQKALKVIIPIGLLTGPVLIGRILLQVFHSNILFYLAVVLPQYLIWPYLSYYDDAGRRPFLSGIEGTVLHWTIVLAVYFYVSRKVSLPRSLALFLLISGLSIVLAHALLTIAGYKFSAEWL